MSGLGMLASAIGGGSAVVGQQAAGDIEQGRRGDLAREQAAIQEQMQMRLAENHERLRVQGRTADFAFDNNPVNVTAAQGTRRSNALAATQDTRDATVAAVGDTTYQGAVKKQADREAADAATRGRQTAKDNAADTLFLSASTKLKLADPEVAARIAASRAQAGEASARTGLLNSQTDAAKLNVDDLRKLNGLYDDASAVLSDAKLTDEERAKRFGAIQRQIVLMKSKSGAGTGGDRELDTVTVKDTKINPDGSTSETTRKEVRKPGNITDKNGTSGPAVGAEVEGYVFKGGDPNDQKNWTKKQSSPPAKASSPTPPPAAEVTSPDSPSGRFKARQEQLKKDRDDMATLKASAASKRATELLKSGTPYELDEFQRSDIFGALDTQTKAAISQRLRSF